MNPNCDEKKSFMINEYDVKTNNEYYNIFFANLDILFKY